MILSFLLKILNILATQRLDSLLMKNYLNMKTSSDTMDYSDVLDEPLWTSVLLEETTLEIPIVFDEELLKDNRSKYNIVDFTSSENFMFYVLNYNLENREIHDVFNNKFISNVLVNIFNPIRYDWVKDYVKYVITEPKLHSNIRTVNNNVINLIVDEYTEEWAFSKILCKDPETLNLLEFLFNEERYETLSIEDHLNFVFKYLNENNYTMNLFVVYFEILNHLKNISETNIYYYELCGVSAYLFRALNLFTVYRAHWYYTGSVPEKAIDLMLNTEESMIILYHCVRLVERKENNNINYESEKINELIYKCLHQVSGCSQDVINKAFSCIDMIRTIHQQQNPTPLSTRFFNYLRCYVLPISIYSESYINNMFDLLSFGNFLPVIEDYTLFNDIEDFYKLTMFLTTD